MADPTQEAPKMQYTYNAEQTVSINSKIDIDLDGEVVQFQITSRHNANADHIRKALAAQVEAYRQTRQMYPKPQIPEAPSATIQARDETGIPIVDGDHKPVMVALPEGTKVFTVAGVSHGKSQDGTKDMLKVFTTEKAEYISGKYGVSCFHAPDQYSDYKSWPVDQKYAPKPGAMHVIIRAPKEGSKYADVVEFRE